MPGRKPNVDVDLAAHAANGSAKSAAACKGKPRPHGMGHPATCEKDYSADEVEFLRAVDRHRADKHDPFPSLATLLRILKSLGYAKPCEPSDQSST
jgi:hypothetical protein